MGLSARLHSDHHFVRYEARDRLRDCVLCVCVMCVCLNNKSLKNSRGFKHTSLYHSDARLADLQICCLPTATLSQLYPS